LTSHAGNLGLEFTRTRRNGGRTSMQNTQRGGTAIDIRENDGRSSGMVSSNYEP
jgi:hypothetical protein